MFGFIIISGMRFFSCNTLNAIPLRCVSMNNQKFKVQSEIFYINSSEPSVFL